MTNECPDEPCSCKQNIILKYAKEAVACGLAGGLFLGFFFGTAWVLFSGALKIVDLLR